MELYLVRHAEAAPLGEKGIANDEDRPLTDAGEKDSRAVGQALRKRGIAFDKVVTSPLLRARQTAEFMLRDWPEPKPELVVCDELTPDSRPKRLGRFLRDLNAERVALVGHMPHLGLLAGWLVGSKKANVDLAKAGAAHISGRAKKGRGTLLWLVTPDWLQA